ncbi:YgfZ/GcvT domain-containing protein [Thiosulfativibrio zosterae]|uniref:Folate-binding protein n=1 Tax=Thiosulfativibrio zosterae TaxID=2675053 RepID=A0A6F8PN54_9GAMM|nr:folate-binding protein YgfZ [Thiosulfativibrio zosterae]BBP43467.1 folate-binding protein [Thiosulfativibrio zosterae]
MINPQWQTFLASQGAIFGDNFGVDSFGHPDLERFLIKNGPVMTSQAHQGLLKLSGEDTFAFLQGQLSNDLKDVTVENAQLSAYCDPQGNVLAIFLIFKVGDDFFLSFDGSLKEIIQKRLTMFVMRSKVKITDESQNLIRIGFAGDFADLDVQRLLGTKLKNEYEVAQLDKEEAKATLIKVPGPYHRYEIFADASSAEFIWSKLRSNSEQTNQHDWQLLNIAAGIPSINLQTQGKLVAQFLNLDKLSGINFKKGCFPGQEIIARMHYRGKVTKRMMRLRFDEPVDVNIGEEIILNDAAEKHYKFMIINKNPDIFKGSMMLGVGTLKPLENVTGGLATESGVAVSIEPMPYDLTDE